MVQRVWNDHKRVCADRRGAETAFRFHFVREQCPGPSGLEGADSGIKEGPYEHGQANVCELGSDSEGQETTAVGPGE